MDAPLEALARFAREVGQAQGADATHEAFLRLVRGQMPCSGAFLVAFDVATRTRRAAYAWCDGEAVDAATLPPLPLNDGPPSRAILKGEVVIANDYQRATQGQYRVDLGRHIDPRVPQSSVCAPVLAGGMVVGVLEVQSVQRDAYLPEHAALLQAAASVLAPAFVDAGTLRAKVEEQAGLLERAGREHAMARGLVRVLLKRLGEKGGIRPEALREIGREMGAGLQAREVGDAAAAYAAMGFGELRLVATKGTQRVFHGHDLLELDMRSAMPTCHFALGFLEGALGTLTKRGTLGTETACQSQGRANCEFVVAERRGS